MQLTASKDHSPFHLLDEGSDRTFMDKQAAARLRHLGFKLVTAPCQLPGRLAHGTLLYLTCLVSQTD